MASRYALSLLIALPTSALLQAQVGTSLEYNGPQAISAVNTETGGEGYPWLSGDGLRMYYAGRVAPDIRILYTERMDLSSAWSTPIDPLPLESGETSGAWLSADELTIWFTTASNQVRRAQRMSTADPFGAAVTLAITGASGTLRCPSLTPNETEMILWRTNACITLQRTGQDSYSYVGPLDVLGTSNATTCRLSADGLYAYFSASYNNVQRPHRMHRASLGEAFTDLEYLSGADFDPAYKWLQPHVNDDATVLMVVRSVSLWPDNDIYETRGSTAAGIGALWADVPVIGPVPTNDMLTIRLPKTHGLVNLRLFDSLGNEVLRTRVNDNMPVDVSVLASGSYLAEIQSAGSRHVSRVVIAH
ncbi:MAG: T9SS type A sorting domain-containing protein [Flavobacteriales bacterium]|nr:T9SS type A sorting domain-containing protein [Flavobacteriales bacterium]